MGLNLLPSGKEEGEFVGWRYQCLVSICLDLLHDTYLIFLTLFINWKTEPCTGSSRAKAGYQKSSLYSLPSAAVRERARLPSHFVINILQPQTALIALDLYINDLFQSCICAGFWFVLRRGLTELGLALDSLYSWEWSWASDPPDFTSWRYEPPHQFFCRPRV